ncbi:hypothetical protein WAI453_011019 [Rhynchosporium graminicola]
MTELSAIDRRHHSELQPLRIRPDSPFTPSQRQRQSSITAAKLTSLLPSPSLVAARAYFFESTTPVEQDVSATQRRKSLLESQVFPRRHSVLPAAKTLAVQLESFSFSGGSKNLHTIPEAEEIVTEAKIESPSDTYMAEVDAFDEVTTPIRRNSSMICGTPQEVLRQVPFQYTHDHLRDWGYAYLGNSATADAFINPVSLRRPSMAAVKIEPTQDNTLGWTTIRARVVPNGKDRKPFIIQKRFDVDELRSSIPQIPSQPTERKSPAILRRSGRTRRSSTQEVTDTWRKDSANIKRKDRFPFLGKAPLPIHIEYALHYLPLLGALMLSGHVRKGDSIDLPIPHPEVWREVLTYIYTGRGSLSAAMKQNICFLAGHA